jgi:hypothetical protein
MGRPSFKPSDDQRRAVAQWVQAKVSIEEMARRTALAPKTFRKHFAEELGLISVETVNTALAMARPRTEVFRPTDEQREMALILAGAQLSRPEIARKLNVSIEVLLEHFAEELEKGPVKCKSDIIASMFYAGKGGNVAAAKVYLLFNGQEANPNPDQQPARSGLLGKKEAASIAAKNAEAGTGWDDLVSPTVSKPN